MKTVLILGAGVYQIPMIRKAREMGYRVIVASYRAEDPGMALADETWVVDTTDREGILARARETGIDAITTTGTDVAVPTIGYVCDALGLPGVSYDTALMAASKTRMQDRFAEFGVPAAAFRKVRDLSQAMNAAEQIGYPVVVKTPDSSGSRGVTMVDSPDGIESAFLTAMQLARHGEVLVEQCLTGLEFGAQVVVYEGRVVHCLCHNDTVTPPPITVPIGHSCPFGLSPEMLAEATEVCDKAVKALGIRDGVCNADLIGTSDGVRMFEIGARIGATGLPEIIGLHYGLDLYEAALRMASGETPDLRLTTGPASAYLLIRAERDGILARARVPQEVSSLPGLRGVNFDYPEGHSVRAFKTGPDRIGDVLVTARTADEADELARQVVDSLDIEVTDA